MHLFLSACFLGISGLFILVATIFLDADGMTHEEYARQAQELVCVQTAGDSCGTRPSFTVGEH